MTTQADPVALANHLSDLAQAVQRVAEDLRCGLADGGDGGLHGGVPPDALLDSAQVAEMFDINIRTLRRWRHEGRVPPPLKMKGPLRWRRADVHRWLEERGQ